MTNEEAEPTAIRSRLNFDIGAVMGIMMDVRDQVTIISFSAFLLNL